MKQNSLAIDYNENYDEIADNMAIGLQLPENVHKGSKHNSQTLLKAVCLYQIFGKTSDVARFMGLPGSTIRTWKLTNWWEELTNQLRQEKTAYFESKADNIIRLGFESIENRLTHGDYATYDNKTNEIIYKPVSAKDSATIVGIMFDKRQISRALPTAINQTTTTHLIEIKQQFDNMTQGQVIEHDHE